MNKHPVCSYRFNWLIFKALWVVIFIALKLLKLCCQLALLTG